MRFAFVSSLVPDCEPRSGFAVANRAVVDGLLALGHEVVSVGAAPADGSEPFGDCRVLARVTLENAKAGRTQKLHWAARAFASGVPFAAAKLSAINERTLHAKVEEASVDACILNSYQMGAAFPALRRRPFLYLAHNVESGTAAENASRAASFIERRMYARDARLLERLERTLAREAAHVWCLSEADRSVFAQNANGTSVLPLLFPSVGGVPESGDAKPFDAVLIGTWTWEANAVGLRWFIREVVPLLPPDMKIAIAGSVPEELDLSDKRLIAMGRVDSADGFLAQGHVVPLVARGGTGIQLKTIEAFQRGLTTVATASSVRGIDHVPANCRVADEPEGFAAALIEAVRAARRGDHADADPEEWVDEQRDRLLAGLTAGVHALG